MGRLIFQAVDARYRPYAEAASPAVQRWCVRNGWEYELQSSPQGVHPYKSRYALVRSKLQAFDYVMWMDIDIVPVKCDPIVYDESTEFTISQDYNGICSGAVLYKAGKWSNWLLSTVHDSMPNWLDHRLQEQDFMASLLGLPALVKRRALFPEHVIANPRSLLGGQQPTFMHVWANAHYEKCLERVRRLANDFLVAYP